MYVYVYMCARVHVFCIGDTSRISIHSAKILEIDNIGHSHAVRPHKILCCCSSRRSFLNNIVERAGLCFNNYRRNDINFAMALSPYRPTVGVHCMR